MQIPIPDDGEYLLKMGPEGLDAFTMKTHSSSALRALVQWGDVQWKELSAAFYQCKQFTIEDNAGAPNLTQVDDLSEMFYGCTEFN